jgi:hypothetical protein
MWCGGVWFVGFLCRKKKREKRQNLGWFAWEK